MRVIRTVNRCVELERSGAVADLNHLPVTLRDGVGQVVPKPPECPTVGMNLSLSRFEQEMLAETERLKSARLAEPLQEWIRQCRADRQRERRQAVGKGKEVKRLHRKFQQHGRRMRKQRRRRVA